MKIGYASVQNTCVLVFFSFDHPFCALNLALGVKSKEPQGQIVVGSLQKRQEEQIDDNSQLSSNSFPQRSHVFTPRA